MPRASKESSDETSEYSPSITSSNDYGFLEIVAQALNQPPLHSPEQSGHTNVAMVPQKRKTKGWPPELVMGSILEGLLREAADSNSPSREPEQPRKTFRRRQSLNRLMKIVRSPSIPLSSRTASQIFPPINPFSLRKRCFRTIQTTSLQPGMETKRARQVVRSSTASQGTAQAIMGLFGRLPGELRNQIYSDLLVSNETTAIKCNEVVCGRGACEHTRLSVVVPLASTCKKIRHEIMPIFCSENRFHFDEAMVRNRCVANWMESMGDHLRLIPKIVLQVELRNRQAPDTVLQYQSLKVEVTWPSGRPVLTYDALLPKNFIDQSELDELLTRLNMQRGRLQDKLLEIMRSDELSDLAWRCRK